MASPKIKTILVGEVTRYRFVVDIGADPVTGKRRQSTRTFDRRKDAQAELAKILHEVNRRTFTVPARATVGEYLTEWLRSATRGKEAATIRNYADALKPVIERYGAKPLQKLSTVDIEDLVDHMLTAGRKRGGKVGAPLCRSPLWMASSAPTRYEPARRLGEDTLTRACRVLGDDHPHTLLSATIQQDPTRSQSGRRLRWPECARREKTPPSSPRR